MEKFKFVICQSFGTRIQWLKALTLSQNSFMISRPASTKFQIIIQPYNSYFLKKVNFGENID